MTLPSMCEDDIMPRTRITELDGPQPDDDDFDISADDIEAARREARAIRAGAADPAICVVHRIPGAVDVRAIRARAQLSQEAFARRFGFAISAIRDWEQGRRTPEGPARTLLLIVDRHPALVEAVLDAPG